jgi:GH18 family chitinase
MKLKEQNPSIKLMASIGGWNMGTELFSHLASNAQLRSKFAQSVLDLLNEFGFDGFDLDWGKLKCGTLIIDYIFTQKM